MAAQKKTARSASGRGSANKGDAEARVACSAEQRFLMIQEAAYYRAERAGFNGDAVEHWLAAEKEIEQRLGAD
jgi:hypothetical protein